MALTFFISPTTQNIATRSGHTISFVAGVSTHVPLEAQAEILALGIPRDGTETAATEPAAIAAQIAALPDPAAIQGEIAEDNGYQSEVVTDTTNPL